MIVYEFTNNKILLHKPKHPPINQTTLSVPIS